MIWRDSSRRFDSLEPLSLSLSLFSDANALSREYEELIKYVDSSFDSYKVMLNPPYASLHLCSPFFQPELAALMYPIFANGYLDLIISGQADAGTFVFSLFSLIIFISSSSRFSSALRPGATELVQRRRAHIRSHRDAISSGFERISRQS